MVKILILKKELTGMQKIILGVVAAFLLPISAAFADVTSDMADGLSLDQVLSNAAADGTELSDAIAQIIAINPAMAEAAVVAAIAINPAQAATIVVAAVQAAPDQSAAITEAAIQAAPTQVSAIQQAAQVATIQAQIESTSGNVDAEATAAGNPNAAEPATPAAPATPAVPNAPSIPATPAFSATPAVPSSGSGGGGSPA